MKIFSLCKNGVSLFFSFTTLCLLTACGGGGSSSSPSATPPTTTTSSTTTTTLAPNPAPSFSYSSSTGTTGVANYQMTVTPSTLNGNGSAITTCGIKSGTTALPASLTVDASTCVISGIPNSTSSATAYTLVATNADGFSTEAAVTLTVNASVARAYVTDTSGGIYNCSINAATGAFTSCDSGYSPGTGWNPFGVAMFTINGKVYGLVATTQIYPCTINVATGSLSCLADNTVTGASFRAISVSTVAGTTYSYLADVNAGKIYQCQVQQASGWINSASCAVTNGGVATTAWSPRGIYVTTVGANKYAYISEIKNGNIYVCSVDSTTGVISGCTISNGGMNPTSWYPYSVFVTAVGANTYAYISSIYGHIYKCDIDATTGVLSSCAVGDGGATGWNPTDVTVSNLGGANYYAYIAGGDSNVYTCNVNATTGALSSCTTNVSPAGGWIQPGFITIFGP